MGRYFFDVFEADGLRRDKVGLNFPSPEQMRKVPWRRCRR
jgi:hypothetical protein